MYECCGIRIPITINWQEALTVYPNRGLRILNLLDQNNAPQLMQTLMFDDEKMIELWKYHIAEHNIDEQIALAKMTRQEFTSYKKEVWEAIVNFSDAQIQGTLREMMKQFKEQVSIQLQPKNLRKAFSDTAEKLDSTQDQEP